MKFRSLGVLFLSTFIYQYQYAAIRVVLTAAITNSHYEIRKQEYINSFNILTKFGYPDVYVVEAIKKYGPTFLDEYSNHIFYATVNNPLLNNCINEAKTLLEGLKYFNFAPEEMVLKITGRYQLVSDYFLKVIEMNPDYDAFVKVNENGSVFTLSFAMKYKYLVEMYESLDYNAMVQCPWVNLDQQMGAYLTQKTNKNNLKIWYFDKLDIQANNYGSSTVPVATDSWVIF